MNTPMDLATLLDEDLITARAELVLKAATAVISAINPGAPGHVADAAALALAARVYRKTDALSDWGQAVELIEAELAAAPVMTQTVRRQTGYVPFAFAGYEANPVYIHPCGTVTDVSPLNRDLRAVVDDGDCDCENNAPWRRIYVAAVS